MKKIYMLAVMVIAIAITSCTKETAIPSIPTTDEATEQSTRAAIPALTQVGDYGNVSSICLDYKGTLWAMYDKGYWRNYDFNPDVDRLDAFFLCDVFNLYRLPRSASMDISEASYFITPDNQLIKVTVNYDYQYVDGVPWMMPHAVVAGSPYPLGLNVVDLSSSFPSGTVFLSLTAGDNGMVFVATGKSSDGEYGGTFPQHTVYRIASNGNVTKIATVDAPVSATMIADWGGEITASGLLTTDQIEYPNIISKAKGSILFGLADNGDIYKYSTTNGIVEYFTPRVPIKCLTSALNGNNPYVLSGNTIIQVRPTLAKDIVVGTIPEDIAAGAYTLRVNADATAFYVGAEFESYWTQDVYKFIIE